MEDAFRRGGEWSEGKELLLLLSTQTPGAAAHEGTSDFLDRLSDLAEQMGALPVTRGPVTSQCTLQV